MASGDGARSSPRRTRSSRLIGHVTGSGNSVDFAVVEEAQDVGNAELRRVIMIAERAADMIRGREPVAPVNV